MKTFKMYSDPSHGWLAVKKELLVELNIAHKISTYSYQRGKTVYLEEDRDASLFIVTYEKKVGELLIAEKHTDKRHPIRSYDDYDNPAYTAKQHVAKHKDSVSDFKLSFSKKIANRETITMNIRYDDECKNGHRSFAMTGEIAKDTRLHDPHTYGCIHDELEKHFPDYAKFIKWHLTNEEGPMYYIENTTYLASQGYLDYARSTAVCLDGTIDQLTNKTFLYNRLPELMNSFFDDMKYLKSLT